MKFLICPDSFKGSLTAKEAAEAIEKGIKKAMPWAETIKMPLADGGEGTLDALTSEGDRFVTTVCGPYFEPVNAHWGFKDETAVIEMAEAAGLCLSDRRKTAWATTYGVGELIKAALDKGFGKILLTAGGSATTDCGCGMMAALGMKFYDKSGKDFMPTGATLQKIAKTDISDIDKRLKSTHISIATDVRNPLLGENGCVKVFAPQKGATESDLITLEKGMQNVIDVLARDYATHPENTPGCGAAGGLPTFLLAFNYADIQRGTDVVFTVNGISDLVKGTNPDVVISGEGKIDSQTSGGKTISGVAGICRENGIPLDCLVGCFEGEKQDFNKLGIRCIYAITETEPNTEKAMKNAAVLLEQTAEKYAREVLIK